MPDHLDHYRKLENMYHGAKVNQLLKPRLTISNGQAEVVFPVGPHMFHGAGAVHGEYYFKALDDSAWFAVASQVTDVFVLTTSFNLHLLRPIDTGEMKGVGKIVARTRTQYIAESIVYDAKGRELARGSGTFVKGTKSYLELDAYK